MGPLLTVGGAREGTFFGLPAIAFSMAAKAEMDFSHAAALKHSSRRTPSPPSARRSPQWARRLSSTRARSATKAAADS